MSDVAVPRSCWIASGRSPRALAPLRLPWASGPLTMWRTTRSAGTRWSRMKCQKHSDQHISMLRRPLRPRGTVALSAIYLWTPPDMSSAADGRGCQGEARDWAMALSFLYLAFVKILEVILLRSSDCDDLAIEVVMLRNEVAVLRRQVRRQSIHLAIECCSPN